MTNEEDNILDELAKDLQANPPCQSQSTQITPTQSKDISKEKDLEAYINDNVQESSDIILQVIKQFAKDVGDDPERAEAFSKLIKSNTDTIKLLNDRLNKDRANKTKKELQKMRGEGKAMEKMIEAQKSITLSRDEMFKEVFKDIEDIENIEVEEIKKD